MLSLFAQATQSTNGLSNLLSNNQLIFWGAIAAIVIVPSALHYWAKVRANESKAALVQDLAARGMTPDEIQAILKASKLDKDCA